MDVFPQPGGQLPPLNQPTNGCSERQAQGRKTSLLFSEVLTCCFGDNGGIAGSPPVEALLRLWCLVEHLMRARSPDSLEHANHVRQVPIPFDNMSKPGLTPSFAGSDFLSMAHVKIYLAASEPYFLEPKHVSSLNCTTVYDNMRIGLHISTLLLAGGRFGAWTRALRI